MAGLTRAAALARRLGRGLATPAATPALVVPRLTLIVLAAAAQVDLKFPDHVSDSARDLISKLLVKDPASRFKLSDIENHPWIRMHCD